MQLRKKRPDYILILTVGLLLLLGLIIIYSISPVLSHKLVDDVDRNYFLYGQLKNIGIGLIGFLVASNLDWRRWRSALPWLVLVTGVTLFLLMIPAFNISKYGATRWIGIGGVSFQPAELMKLTLVVLAAAYFSNLSVDKLKDRKEALWPTAGLLGVAAIFVLFLQKDLGTMLVIAAIVMSIFFMSGVDLKQVVMLGGLGLGVGTLSIVMFPHRIERVLTFANPDADIGGAGYHLYQALIAVGSGGLFGLGLGKSIQVYGYLPEAANDSIFAILAETFGFVGVAVVLGLFSILIHRCLRVAAGAPDTFSRLMVVGITVWVGVQAAVNIGAMLGIIPLTGIPLPFLSYGGSSLLLVLVGMGIVVNVSKYVTKENYANRTQRRRNRGAYNPAFSGRPGTV